jgi:photosystem II stability/assembly factor-like uncharacterized protein
MHSTLKSNILCCIGAILFAAFMNGGAVNAQARPFDWALMATTTYEAKYFESEDSEYWVPNFSSDLDYYNGREVCITGYLDSTSAEGMLLLVAEPRAWGCRLPDIQPHGMIDVIGAEWRKVSKNRVEVCGVLELNRSDVYKMNFRLHGKTSQMLPPWMPLMQSDRPSAQAVRDAYEKYHQEHPFQKTRYTQAYKRWVVQQRGHWSAGGLLQESTPIAPRAQSRGGGAIWSYAGPQVHYAEDGTMTPGFRHSNVYCHDRSSTNPNVLYCGTESGGAYKTVDAGQHWEHVTKELIVGDVQSIRIHPENEAVVIMSAANDLWRTTDGGETWTVIGQSSFVNQNIRAWELAFSPDNPSIVYAATNLGFFRSADGGDNWTEVLTQECNTLAIKPNDPSVVYTIQRLNASSSQFYKSTDYGVTWTSMGDGWFENGVGVLPEGGRLAVTAADPERIYALLVGYQTDNATVIANGWIGCWVSYDAGANWVLPHGLIGAPYTESHPNLMNFSGDDGEYTQINYNTTMIASQIDPDKVLIGGLNLWMSTDACATYQGVGGYIGGIDYFHVDQQEYRVYLNGDGTEEIWFSNDGGIGHSADFMSSHQNLNYGLQAVNLWGYDQGWNEDMMVGGRYHNGNMGYHELYPAGEFLALGGGESATGYVNYTDENRTFHSDIGGYVLPDDLADVPVGFTTTMYPNESYWNNSSSRILFDNAHFNTAWLGKDNALYRSLDGGASFDFVYAFSNNTNDRVLWIEQSYSDAQVMYVHFVSGNQSRLYRTEDGGETWGEMDIPQNLREMVFSAGGVNPNELWLAYYYGSDGAKVYHTVDAGASWENWTTPVLNDEEIWAIAHQYGTNGGVYIAVKNGAAYYRNASMDDWMLYAEGLPASTEPLRLVPFYKGEKIRLATWNLGVWEAPFYEPSEVIADFASATGSYQCPGSAIHFVNHSVVPAGASYSWEFPGATPSTSNEENPTVVYGSSGSYDVTLTVIVNGIGYFKTKTNYIAQSTPASPPLNEDFEGGGFPAFWTSAHSSGGNGNWQVNDEASGYGIGANTMMFDNWYYDAQGGRDEVILPRMSINSIENAAIAFDVAYARYNQTWSDTLAVLVSLDCGETWQEVFVKGGTELSTAPDQSSSPFVPTSEQWRTEQIDLSDFLNGGSQDVLVAFQNRGYYGQWLYVDNINVSESTSTHEPNDGSVSINVFPNPAQDVVFVELHKSTGDARLHIMDATGRLVKEVGGIQGTHVVKRIQLDNLAAGSYFVRLVGDETKGVARFEIK